MPQKRPIWATFFCRQLKVAEKLKKVFEKKLHFAQLFLKIIMQKKFSLKKYILNRCKNIKIK